MELVYHLTQKERDRILNIIKRSKHIIQNERTTKVYPRSYQVEVCDEIDKLIELLGSKDKLL